MKSSMSRPRSRPVFTVDEYLRHEREADERHFYCDGEIFAMAGESPVHGEISVNLVISLGEQLRGKPCRLRTKVFDRVVFPPQQ